jgi:penicillin-binding protein 2
MKLEDEAQNLRLRLRLLQGIVVALLVFLAVRLYAVQITNGGYYAERALNQRIRLLPIPAARGSIFDRNGRLLVDSRSIYNVILSREDLKGRELGALVEPFSSGLGVDSDYLAERFEELESQPAFQSVRVKENATVGDIAWVDAHTLEYPELRVEKQPQRRYPENGTLAHVLGYVGEIGPEQLKEPSSRQRGYKPGDIIGQSGLEAAYDNYLRGKEGYRKVVVDSHGRIQDEIERVEPQPGQDLISTIDLDLQLAAEEQLRNSPQKRGVMIAMNPNNGEVLALASYPTFDPNLFSQRMTTTEGRKEYAGLLNDPRKPLLNRAIQGRYPPGSTWKTMMAVAGLQQGAISAQRSNLICGGGITIGNKFTRCMGGNHGSPDLHYAITHSCDGYFYRLGLRMGIDGIMKMVDEFDLNKPSGIDLPHEVISLTPSPDFKARIQPRDPEWRDIDTVYASFGQGEDVLTPIALIRAVSAIGVGGKLFVPHLLKEIREVDAEAGRGNARIFERTEPKVIPIAENDDELVVRSMWSVVNEGGTAARIRMPGFDIAGKTGTAQVVQNGKDVGDKKDHAWFVSYAPAFKPEISCVALIENSGVGGVHAAPAVRAIYDVYYRKTRDSR